MVGAVPEHPFQLGAVAVGLGHARAGGAVCGLGHTVNRGDDGAHGGMEFLTGIGIELPETIHDLLKKAKTASLSIK